MEWRDQRDPFKKQRGEADIDELEREAKEVIEYELKDKIADEFKFNKEFSKKLKIATEETERQNKQFLREMKNQDWKELKHTKKVEKERVEEKKRQEMILRQKELKTQKDLDDKEAENVKEEKRQSTLNAIHNRDVKEKEIERQSVIQTEFIYSRKQMDLVLKQKKIQDKKNKWEEELKYYENLLN